MEYTPLTLSQVDNLPKVGTLYVINAINSQTNIGNGGKIIFSCNGANGKDTVIMIEDTWIPQDLSSQSRKNDVLESSDFRKIVSLGKLHVISDEDAAKIMDTDEAKEQYKAVYKSDLVQAPIQINAIQAGGVKVTTNTSQINPKVMSLVAKSNSETMQADEVISVLKGSKGITEDDYKYILSTSTDAAIKRYVSSVLNQK